MMDHRAEPTVAWLIGVARHKLVDHWRRLPARSAAAGGRSNPRGTTTRGTLTSKRGRPTRPWPLVPHHRGALTLRYLDGLPVPEVPSCSAAPYTPPRPCSCAPTRPSAMPTRRRATRATGRRKGVTPSTPCACRRHRADPAFAAAWRRDGSRAGPTDPAYPPNEIHHRGDDHDRHRNRDHASTRARNSRSTARLRPWTGTATCSAPSR